MIITVKNLQQQTFTIEFDPSNTVLELKETIFRERGAEYVVDKQKLIYAGVILSDDRTIASYNVDQNKFIVVILKRDFGYTQKPDESGASTSKSATSIGSTCSRGSIGNVGSFDPSGSSKSIETLGESLAVTKRRVEKVEDKLASEEDTKSVGSGGSTGGIGSAGSVTRDVVMLEPVGSRTSIESTTSGNSLLSTGGGGNSVESETSHSTYTSGDLAGVFSSTSLQSRAESNLLMGEEYSRSIESMVEMGYSRDLVERAMTASFNNPERAVEYLISGIPPESTEGFNAAAIAEQDHAVVGQNIDLSTMETSANIDIPPGADPFVFLRNQPQFLHMRSLVYENPDLLHAVLDQIGQTNPALLQLISENQDAFLNMLNEPIEGQQNTAPIYPRRMTPGRRAQLAASALAAAGGDGPHVQPLDTAPGASGDGLPLRPSPGDAGDAGRDTIPHDTLLRHPDRGAERRAAAARQFMRDRAAAAAAVDRDVGGGGGDAIRVADIIGDVEAIGRDVGAAGTAPGGDGGASAGDDAGVGAGGDGLNVRLGSPPRSMPPTAIGVGADGDIANAYQLTSADREAIERLTALGFPEALVLQAYFICDKNEQIAANFLISSTFDD